MLRVLLFFERIETGFSGPMAEWSGLLKLLQVVAVVEVAKNDSERCSVEVRLGRVPWCFAGRRGWEKSFGPGLTPPLPLPARELQPQCSERLPGAQCCGRIFK